jgi:nitroimidazol reductase NimA-like FMN-containing flavoprotein (pyridoxamine 5'-phosphate oxidase superfamily)
VGFVLDRQPYVVPMTYARDGDVLYLHGALSNRTLRALSQGGDTCITVTLLDGLVLARSATHHSMNYRAVMAFGKARELTDTAEKLEALRAIVEHVVPGRWNEVRAPDARELRQTLVLSVSLDEASAKVRSGMPIDDDADYALPVWAGEIPLRLVPQAPVDDPRLAPGTEQPADLSAYARPARKGAPAWNPRSES